MSRTPPCATLLCKYEHVRSPGFIFFAFGHVGGELGHAGGHAGARHLLAKLGQLLVVHRRHLPRTYRLSPPAVPTQAIIPRAPRRPPRLAALWRSSCHTRVTHTHTRARAAMSTPGGWFSALPVVMRAWGVSCVATTCAVSAGLVSPYRIALDWGLLLRRFQVSRARRRQPRRLCALWSRPDLTGCRGSACVNRLRTPPCAQSCRSRRRPRARVRPHVQCGGTGKGEGGRRARAARAASHSEPLTRLDLFLSLSVRRPRSGGS